MATAPARRRTSSGVTEVDSLADIPNGNEETSAENTEELDDTEDYNEPVSISVRNKTKQGAPRMVLMEATGTEDDLDVPHSGVVVNGTHQFNTSPVRGGMIITTAGLVVNHRGHEIDPKTGRVLDPSKYADEMSNIAQDLGL